MSRIIEAFEQFFDGEGNPLIDGFLKFTVSGTNATDKDTFADSAQKIANTNPVPLDSEGRCPNVFGSGSYRITLYTSDLQQIDQKDPVGGSVGTAAFDSWNGETSYVIRQIVEADDTFYYRSTIENNQGNTPSVSSISWEKVDFKYFHNTTRTYLINEIVIATNARYYKAISENTGQEPTTKPLIWKEITYNDIIVEQETTGVLVPMRINYLIDSGTFTLPLAASVSIGAWVEAELSDLHKAETPDIIVSGTDSLVSYAGIDADGIFSFNTGHSLSIRFISNGIDTWEI